MKQKNPFEVIFENEDFIVINKSSGVLSIPDRFDAGKANLYDLLSSLYATLYVVHRIDRDTSGLILFARNETAHKELSNLFESRSIEKEYLAICHSAPDIEEGMIDMPIAHSTRQAGLMTIHPKGKPAKTLYKLVSQWKDFSLIRAKPITGRTHQIRVHLSYLQCPIIGDRAYGGKESVSISDLKTRKLKVNYEEPTALISRVALHASKLSFPFLGKDYSFLAELPKDMEVCIKQFDKWIKK